MDPYTPSQVNPVQQPEPPKHGLFHSKLLGYGFLVVVFVVSVFGIYQWQYGGSTNNDNNDYDNDSEVCIQVIQRARNPQTGQERDFPTPCDVPDGWEIIEPEQLEDTSNWKTYRNEEFGFEFKYPSEYYITTQGELYSENSAGLEDLNKGVEWAGTQWIRVGYQLANSRDAELAQELEAKNLDSGYVGINNNGFEKIIESNNRKIKLGIYSNYPANDAYDLNAYFYDNQYNSIFIGLDSVGKTVEEAMNSPMNQILNQILSSFRFTKIAQESPDVEQDLFKKYGFTVEFPQAWEDYHMSEFVGSSRSYICFSFTGYCVMQTVMYTPEQFEEFKLEIQDSRYDYLTPEERVESIKFDFKNDKYYYFFSYVPSCAQLSEFECARTNEVPAIASTFKFIENN